MNTIEYYQIQIFVLYGHYFSTFIDISFQVTDFGLSVVKGGVGHDNMMQDFCGTPIYMCNYKISYYFL